MQVKVNVTEMEEDFDIPAWKYALVKDHFQGDVKAKHAKANIHSNVVVGHMKSLKPPSMLKTTEFHQT